jgi:hypothetical protein
MRPARVILAAGLCVCSVVQRAWADPYGRGTVLSRIRAALDAVPAIDTYDHLWSFEQIRKFVETSYGPGMNLWAIWRNSYV